MKSSILSLSSGGLASLCRLGVVACMAVVLAAGCSKSAPTDLSASRAVSSDPQVVSNLDMLTDELHHCMNSHGRHLTGSFDEFVEVAQLTPPPPPPGKKYAINKGWRVILVDANTK